MSLYVIEEANARGDIFFKYFRLPKDILDRALELYKRFEETNDPSDYDTFDEYMNEISTSQAWLVSELVKDKESVTKLLNEGWCHVEGEESVYGIGNNPDLAYKGWFNEPAPKGWQ